MNRHEDADLDLLPAAWDDFVRSIRRARARNAGKHDADGLSLAQYLLLVPLLDEEPLASGELAARAAVSPPSATRMIDTLQRSGLVERSSCPKDRRVVHVRLTDTGRTKLEAKREHIRERRREIAREMSPAERAEAARILRRMADLVDTL